MKHVFTHLLSILSVLILLPQNSSAQNFGWSSTTFDITSAAPLVLTSNVTNMGILNSSEGKVPTVVVNISHTYVADIDITLTSPAGTEINLTTGNGGSGDDYSITVFSHFATNSITSGTAPFNGFFLPQESFTAFDGEFADGIWTMTITDNFTSDEGYFNSGQINFIDRNPFSYLLDNGSTNHQGDFLNDLILPSSGVNWGTNIHNQSNSALEFNGTNHARATDENYPTNAVTLAAWIKPSNVNSDQKVINIVDNDNAIDLISLGIYNGTADFEVKEDAGSGRVSMGDLTDDEWVHIAGTWSLGDNTVRLYVNGELVGTDQGPGVPLSFFSASPGNYAPYFGVAGWDNSVFHYEGSMDDMRMYNAALTEWQIKDIVANYNQFCETAIPLPVEGNSCDGSYYAHNYGGNGVNGPITQCTGNAGGASWFTVTVPSSGSLTISSSQVTGSDMIDNVIEVYSGTCDNLTYIDCEDDPLLTSSFAEVVLTNRTPGEVLFVKSWEYSNNEHGQYVICAFDQDLSANHPTQEDIQLKVFPNPASNFVTIEAELNSTTDVTIVLKNTLGQLIEELNLPNTKTINQNLNVSELPNGIYFVSILGENVSSTERIVVRN